jgi:hypothetical protein
MRSVPQEPLPVFPAATAHQARYNGTTPVAHRNHSHVDRDPHGSGSGVVRVHHAYHMGALPLHYRCTTLGTPSYYRQITVALANTRGQDRGDALRTLTQPASDSGGGINLSHWDSTPSHWKDPAKPLADSSTCWNCRGGSGGAKRVSRQSRARPKEGWDVKLASSPLCG